MAVGSAAWGAGKHELLETSRTQTRKELSEAHTRQPEAPEGA